MAEAIKKETNVGGISYEISRYETLKMEYRKVKQSRINYHNEQFRLDEDDFQDEQKVF